MADDALQIYSSERNAAVCRVHFETIGTESRIEGTLRGPFCKYSHTLPSTIPIRNGIATVVDPCYWTPRLPFRYEVKIDVESGSQSDHLEFMWGMRWCVPHQSNLLLDGKGYVVRAAEADDDIDLDEFRALSCGLFTKRRLEANVYETASESGVLIVAADNADYSRDRSTAAIALHPAVHFLHAGDFRTDALSLEVGENTHAILQSETEAKEQAESKSARYPTLVERQIVASSLSDMRRECDTLQRDLAKHGQFAGYLISRRNHEH